MIRRIFALIPLPLAFALRAFAANHPDWMERHFASGIYPAVAEFISHVSNVFPFPLIEICLVFAVFFMVLLLIQKKFFLVFTSLCLCAALILGGWSLNYFRLPLEKTLGLTVRASSVSELISLSEKLAEDANIRYVRIVENNLEEANNALNAASNQYPIPYGTYGTPKIALASPVLSKFLVEGITSPLTLEALVNGDIPKASIPFVACHEAAHVRGFAREEDANLIAFLACESSGNAMYRYSGSLNALMYTLSALGSADAEAYQRIYATISPDVRADFAADAAFWEPFREKTAAKVGTQVNEAYLQTIAAGDQSVRSYGRLVDLLLALNRIEEEETATR